MASLWKITGAVTAAAVAISSCGVLDSSESSERAPAYGSSSRAPRTPAPPTMPAATTPATVPSATATRTSTTRTWSPQVSGPVNSDPLLGANPVLLERGVGVAKVNCRLPSWRVQAAAARVYYQAAITCHDNAWRGSLNRFGLKLASPKLWAGAQGSEYSGACGSNSTGREAFYCSADQTIVMPFDSMRPVARYGEGYVLAVLSHEYGHHLQEQIGVMAAYQARGQSVGYRSTAGQLLSRQLELQAWCFSGMFYGTNTGRGSITRSLNQQAFDNNSHAGDRPGELRQHGTNQNVGNWFGWGRNPGLNSSAKVAPSSYECNPWAARDAGWLR